MIELFFNSVIYSFCIFVPLLALYAVFMIWTGRWEVKTNMKCGDFDCDLKCESCEYLPVLLRKQAD